MSRELLFKVQKSDFDESHIRGSGPGGQHRNKTSTGVRLVHRESGAVGEAVDSKSQAENRKKAFRRLMETTKWKVWFNERCLVALGQPSIEDVVAEQMAEHNIVTQVLDDRNRWIDVGVSDLV